MATTKKVTRITATDDAPKSARKPDTKAKKAQPTTKQPGVTPTGKRNIFARIGGYFKGAWSELRQVRWPSRGATWSLTLAVIVFSIFFVVLILLLDTLFQFLFDLIIT